MYLYWSTVPIIGHSTDGSRQDGATTKSMGLNLFSIEYKHMGRVHRPEGRKMGTIALVFHFILCTMCALGVQVLLVEMNPGILGR